MRKILLLLPFCILLLSGCAERQEIDLCHEPRILFDNLASDAFQAPQFDVVGTLINVSKTYEHMASGYEKEEYSLTLSGQQKQHTFMIITRLMSGLCYADVNKCPLRETVYKSYPYVKNPRACACTEDADRVACTCRGFNISFGKTFCIGLQCAPENTFSSVKIRSELDIGEKDIGKDFRISRNDELLPYFEETKCT